MRKFQCLLFVLTKLMIYCYYIICMTWKTKNLSEVKKRRMKKEIFFQNNTRQKECISCVPFPFLLTLTLCCKFLKCVWPFYDIAKYGVKWLQFKHRLSQLAMFIVQYLLKNNNISDKLSAGVTITSLINFQQV